MTKLKFVCKESCHDLSETVALLTDGTTVHVGLLTQIRAPYRRAIYSRKSGTSDVTSEGSPHMMIIIFLVVTLEMMFGENL